MMRRSSLSGKSRCISTISPRGSTIVGARISWPIFIRKIVLTVPTKAESFVGRLGHAGQPDKMFDIACRPVHLGVYRGDPLHPQCFREFDDPFDRALARFFVAHHA